jgi:hypothetical protein
VSNGSTPLFRHSHLSGALIADMPLTAIIAGMKD